MSDDQVIVEERDGGVIASLILVLTGRIEVRGDGVQ